MITCEHGNNIVVVYQMGFLNTNKCPLCEAEEQVVELTDEVERLEEQISVLEFLKDE
jgi:transposase-like protein